MHLGAAGGLAEGVSSARRALFPALPHAGHPREALPASQPPAAHNSPSSLDALMSALSLVQGVFAHGPRALVSLVWSNRALQSSEPRRNVNLGTVCM
jgi:hypothetical protein